MSTQTQHNPGGLADELRAVVGDKFNKVRIDYFGANIDNASDYEYVLTFEGDGRTLLAINLHFCPLSYETICDFKSNTVHYDEARVHYCVKTTVDLLSALYDEASRKVLADACYNIYIADHKHNS